MSRSRKVVLVLATVLLVGGSALSLFAFAKAGFSLQNLSTTRDWVSSTRTLPSEAEAPHTALVVHDGCQSIRLEPTDDDAFQVEYWTNERRSVSLTDQDGVPHHRRNRRAARRVRPVRVHVVPTRHDRREGAPLLHGIDSGGDGGRRRGGRGLRRPVVGLARLFERKRPRHPHRGAGRLDELERRGHPCRRRAGGARERLARKRQHHDGGRHGNRNADEPHLHRRPGPATGERAHSRRAHLERGRPRGGRRRRRPCSPKRPWET